MRLLQAEQRARWAGGGIGLFSGVEGEDPLAVEVEVVVLVVIVVVIFESHVCVPLSEKAFYPLFPSRDS